MEGSQGRIHQFMHWMLCSSSRIQDRKWDQWHHPAMGGTISGSLIKCGYHPPLLITVLWIRANQHRRTGGQSRSRSSATHVLTHPIRAPGVGTFPAGMGLCGKSPPHITGPGYRTDAGGRPHSGAEGKGECWVGWRHPGWVSSSHTHLWWEVNCCNVTWYPEV